MLKRLFKHLAWRYKMLIRIHWPQFWFARFLPPVIQTGPFQGMYYYKVSTGSVILPKLTGTYESELHPVFDSINMSTYDTCIDVGAGEGYYAVGLAWRFHHLHIIAFETSPTGRRRIRALARRNGVLSRMDVRGLCLPEDLQEALATSARNLLILDVEGFEEQLLDPIQIPALTRTDFIAEVHPEFNPDLGKIIKERFNHTHHLETIEQLPEKSLPESIVLPGFLQAKRHFFTNEFRGPQFWVIGRVKQH